MTFSTQRASPSPFSTLSSSPQTLLPTLTSPYQKQKPQNSIDAVHLTDLINIKCKHPLKERLASSVLSRSQHEPLASFPMLHFTSLNLFATNWSSYALCSELVEPLLFLFLPRFLSLGKRVTSPYKVRSSSIFFLYPFVERDWFQIPKWCVFFFNQKVPIFVGVFIDWQMQCWLENVFHFIYWECQTGPRGVLIFQD